jgi:hypothetical protein
VLSTGLEVVANHEGGFAAAVIALLANKKVSFHTEVPEQVPHSF